MKRIIYSVLAILMAFSIFSGCQSELIGVTSNNGSSSSSKASNSQTTELSGKLTLNGSTSMAKVCQALGEAFMEKYPNVTVEKSGTGSGDAPKAVVAGTALIGDLSRELKKEENSENFEVVPIAIDGIAIIVHKDNKISSLTKEQITKIFTGEVNNWKQLGGDDLKITVLGREAASGTRDGFESIFKCKEKCNYAAEVTSTGEVIAKTGNDKSAIGYVSLDSVNNTVKACDIDGVKASEENVSNKSYTVQRPFIEIYKKGSDSTLIKAWFEFIKSEQGQNVIQEAGLVAAK